jgi:hypothetical protein
MSVYSFRALIARTACEGLDTNQDGFLQPGVDFEQAKIANRRLFKMCLEDGKEEALTPFENEEEYVSISNEYWPFKEGL